MLSKEEINAGEKTLTRYAGGSFEIEEGSLGTKQRHYVGDFLVVETEGTYYREHYLYKDYLGSILAAADQTGAIIERMDYDPFGQRRSVQDLSWLDGFTPRTTSRGFTGHDHVASMDLIHMKGRIYDPKIGLFLSADPYVQEPTLLQNFNRYSYVINNPLSYTDPSGHLFKHAFRELGRGLTSASKALQNPGRFLEKTWSKLSKGASDARYHRLAASIAISVAATIWQPQWASASWEQTAAYYAAVGYTSSYVATNGDKKAALNGAITAAAFNVVGSYFENVKMDTGMRLAKVAAHGTVGGLSAVANGGRFESGFLSSGLSELAGQNNLYGSAKGNGWEIASGAARAAIVGGTISELSGGSFESGALNAAMGRLFNGVAHEMRAYITTAFTAGGAAAGLVVGGLGGGAAAGVVSGGTLAIPGAGYGAAQGAAYGSAIGYVAANVTLIAADAIENWMSSDGNDQAQAPGTGKRFTPDQGALVEIAKEAERAGGVTKSEAEILVNWGKEVGFGDRARGPESHPNRPFGKEPHIHVGPVNHLPVRN
jgi:RHS repeat-associated protein